MLASNSVAKKTQLGKSFRLSIDGATWNLTCVRWARWRYSILECQQHHVRAYCRTTQIFNLSASYHIKTRLKLTTARKLHRLGTTQLHSYRITELHVQAVGEISGITRWRHKTKVDYNTHVHAYIYRMHSCNAYYLFRVMLVRDSTRTPSNVRRAFYL